MTESQRDRQAYALAKEYLLTLHIPGVSAALLQKYLTPCPASNRPAKIHGIYARLLESAQNANMKAGVVGRSIGGVNKLRTVLCRFNPRAVVKLYGSDWRWLLDQIEYRIKPRGKIRKSRRSIWPQYCRTILSAARFMSQFSTADEFYRWVDFFDHDDRARAGLPLLLHCEIRGVGFTLGCDFLKELGYANFAKPDVHVRDIFGALHLCPKEADDYEVFKSVVRLAKNAGVTPYEADKLFWLVGSGYFYDDLHIGHKGRIGSHKWKFIAFAKRKLIRS